MIVLTEIQKNSFLKVKETFTEQLRNCNADYVPIEIKGGFWILPDEVLMDERFFKLKSELEKIGEFDKYIKRDFDKSELIVTEP